MLKGDAHKPSIYLSCWKNNSKQQSWRAWILDPWASDVSEQNQTDDSTSKSRNVKQRAERIKIATWQILKVRVPSYINKKY